MLPFVANRNNYIWHNVDVNGISPSLVFSMLRAPNGARVSEMNYRGKVVMLYFGYTFCPDVCPLTLQNVATILDRMGTDQAAVDMLFATVDPKRDDLKTLARYTALFSPRIVGLRGSSDELARLARRFRIAYSVTSSGDDHDIEVTHSSAIYVFDRTSACRLLVPSLASPTPDIAGVVSDLTMLIHEPLRRSWLNWRS